MRRHHHGYAVSQMRHTSWSTRQCAHPTCRAVVLTWQARLLLLLVLALVVWAVVVR